MFFEPRLTPLATGLASRVPGLLRLIQRGTGGSNSARYCYSVWLRHLVSVFDSCGSGVPRSVAELGPGDSLGTGYAALLSGVDRYLAFDVVRYATGEDAEAIFDEVLALLTARSPIPDDGEFPLVRPRLRSYAFPAHILTDELLSRTLSSKRVDTLRKAITADMSDVKTSAECPLSYVAPWLETTEHSIAPVEMIMSQAVLEHVDDLVRAYKIMRLGLKPGGVMSHTIDFCSHGLTSSWNGHWTLSRFQWALIRGRKPYLINRQPLARHLSMLAEAGFKLVALEKYKNERGVSRAALAGEFAAIDSEDLTTSEAFLIAQLAG